VIPEVAILAALPEEVSTLRRRLRDRTGARAGSTSLSLGTLGSCRVVVAVVGEGAQNARRGTEEVLAALPVRRALLVGVSGALSPGLGPAALVVARAVIGPVTRAAAPGTVERVAAATGAIPGLAVTAPDLVETPQDKAFLRRAIPDEPAVVDLESAAVVAALAHVGIPWIVLRAVTDTADEALPPIVRSGRDEQGLHRVRMVGNALLDPTAAADLWRLGRRMRACAHALATAAEQVLIAVESLPDIAAAR
jgi:adenosylhomocysteine nucleosidase